MVDDDASVRDALALLLRIEGFAVQCFGDDVILKRFTRDTGLRDSRSAFAGRSGAGNLAQTFRRPICASNPRDFWSVWDIAMAVEAMKFGALDFLEKAVFVGSPSSAVFAPQ